MKSHELKRKAQNLHGKHDFNTDTSNNPANTNSSVDASVLSRHDYAFVDRQSTSVLRNFLQSVKTAHHHKDQNLLIPHIKIRSFYASIKNFTSLISTISPVLISGTGLTFSDTSIAFWFSIYTQQQHLMALESQLIKSRNQVP